MSKDIAPEEVPSWQLLSIPPMGGSLYANTMGTAEAGMFLPAIDGERYYHANAGDYVYYMQTRALPSQSSKVGKFFLQSKTGFIGDVGTGGAAGGVARRTSGTKAVIKTFMDVFIGALACAGGPLAWSITGMNLFVMSGNVVRNYKKYEDAMVAILASRKIFRDRMPVFYRTVLWELYFGTVEQQLMSRSKDILSEAIPGPKVAGKLVGVLLGALGEDKLQVRLKALKELFSEVLEKVAKHAMDQGQPLGAGKICLSEDQVTKLAELHVMRILKTTNCVLPRMEEAKEIVREAVRNWNVRSDLHKLVIAIDAMG